ncbi:hypothetical protein [Pararhodonellum marinum]|uniref:hypothetical protein n=1 Tax=Pararhodonellum marinum TaxID=2755358 RepID=UPI00188F42C5|nr:hypothetical protein [Pararhodonellum marinum]
MRLIMALLVAMGISGNSLAHTGVEQSAHEDSVVLQQVKPGNVKLVYREVPNGPVYVKITDQDNKTLVKDRIQMENPFSKNYNMEYLKPGLYHVEVKNNNGLMETYDLDMRPAKEEPVVYSKVEMVGDRKFKLVVNAVAASNLIIRIYDKNELIHQEVVEDVKGVQKLYTIQGIRQMGNIVFQVSNDQGFDQYLSAR